MDNRYDVVRGEHRASVIVRSWDGGTNLLTCSNGTARELAVRLESVWTKVAASLYDVAVEQGGRPAAARRHLLDVYTASLAGDSSRNLGGPWAKAEKLVAALAASARQSTVAVQKTVRRELGRLLEGYDEPLIPIRFVTSCHKRSHLDLGIPASEVSQYLSERTWNLSSRTTGFGLSEVRRLPRTRSTRCRSCTTGIIAPACPDGTTNRRWTN